MALLDLFRGRRNLVYLSDHELRTSSVARLHEVVETAQRMSLHAQGRPQWLAENANAVDCVLWAPIALKSNPVRSFRCQVTLLQMNAGAVKFYVDVLPDDYNKLELPNRRHQAHIIRRLSERATFIAP